MNVNEFKRLVRRIQTYPPCRRCGCPEELNSYDLCSLCVEYDKANAKL